MIRLQQEAGFTLIEVLASAIILALVATGLTALWRLADYKELVSRLDHRAQRILQQCYEVQEYAPARLKPFDKEGDPNPGTAVLLSGFLYYPRLSQGTGPHEKHFGALLPYSLHVASGIGTRKLVLQYELPGIGSAAPRQMEREIGIE